MSGCDPPVSNRYIKSPLRDRSPLTLPARMIALEGIDQSGKRTQSRLLRNRLKRLGFIVRIISFPIYRSPSGRLIERYLKGEQNYPTEALHMLYSLNRWENQELIQGLLKEADFLIADRYAPSNLAYGLSKGVNLTWLIGLDSGLPKADLIIILALPVRSSFARKSKHRDVHEKNSTLLASVNESYRKLGKKLGWKAIDATASVQDVESAIWKIVQTRFRIPHRKQDQTRSS